MRVMRHVGKEKKPKWYRSTARNEYCSHCGLASSAGRGQPQGADFEDIDGSASLAGGNQNNTRKHNHRSHASHVTRLKNESGAGSAARTNHCLQMGPHGDGNAATLCCTPFSTVSFEAAVSMPVCSRVEPTTRGGDAC